MPLLGCSCRQTTLYSLMSDLRPQRRGKMLLLKTRTLYILLALLMCQASITTAFLPSRQVLPIGKHPAISNIPRRSATHIKVAGQEEQNQTNRQRKYQRNKKQTKITIGDLKKELLSNPAAAQLGTSKPKKSQRTRRRVENPQQKYVYAAQRIKLEKRNNNDQSFLQNENPGRHYGILTLVLVFYMLELELNHATNTNQATSYIYTLL